MCGRFTLTTAPDLDKFPLSPQAEFAFVPRYNVAPSQYCQVFPQGQVGRLQLYRWGLVPYWAKDENIGNKLINARSETIFEKPSFKKAIQSQRCLVFADGFYEWKRMGKQKQAYRITLKEEQVFTFAGIYDQWTRPEGDILYSFSIITTEPNELMEGIHNRMPAILAPNDITYWLDPASTQEEIQKMLRPYPSHEMKAYTVSPSVGNVRNDHKSLILPYQAPPSLF